MGVFDTDLSHAIAGSTGVVAVVLTLQVVPGQAGGLAAGTEGGDGGGQEVARSLSLGPGDHGGRMAWSHGYIVSRQDWANFAGYFASFKP